jgi:hypothetical protein
MFIASVQALANKVMAELTIYGEIMNAFLIFQPPHQLL